MSSTSQPTRSDEPYNNVSIVKYKASTSEVIQLGPARLDVLEDGRNTDNRLGAVYITVPPKCPGPPQHWHQMHDETFLVMKGTATFSSRDGKFTAQEGDYVVVPLFAPHTFANDSPDTELVMYNTFSPAHYVNYFRYMAGRAEKEGKFTPQIGKDAMERYATIQTTEW